MKQTDDLLTQAKHLLRSLIAIPSFSKEEQGTADLLCQFLSAAGVGFERMHNNVWARCRHFDTNKRTILLCSHHDTVRPSKEYTRNPFLPTEADGKLYGLGSNDAGASLVALLVTFLYFTESDSLPYNLIFTAVAEEEISGINGISALLPELGPIDCAIVGEPTNMQMAIAEKGLLVLDCEAKGASGHAARDEGENAIYKAMQDIEQLRAYEFPKTSPLLGPVKMSITMIQAGMQHNVIPDRCRFTVDIRVNDCYTHEEIIELVRANIQSEVQPRSLRLKATRIEEAHPLVVAGKALGLCTFGSATLSDKALMPFPCLKIGPGDSLRSHTADEFIYLKELKSGIVQYIELLKQLQ
jgi:acetylornithine deacetylase